MNSGNVRWPDAGREYTIARDELRDAEHDLTRTIESVAAKRRALPQGSEVDNYEFVEGPQDIASADLPAVIRLDDLFGRHSTVMLYNFMFDGSTQQPCPMCTSLIDGFEGAAADLSQRVGFAVVAPAPLAQLRAYGRSRGWRNVRLLSDPDGTYSRDSGGISASGELRSLMTVFTRRDGSIRHFYTSKKPPSSPGQDDRHLDLLWALWGSLDLTPEGRDDWRPSRPDRN